MWFDFRPHVAAVILAASIQFGFVPASAADLGGDCCADLEERVAELEATRVRKGNKKVKLELYGRSGPLSWAALPFYAYRQLVPWWTRHRMLENCSCNSVRLETFMLMMLEWSQHAKALATRNPSDVTGDDHAAPRRAVARMQQLT
jgi:hypothetical protein